MNKKAYMKPAMQVVKVEQQLIVCQSGGSPNGYQNYSFSKFYGKHSSSAPDDDDTLGDGDIDEIF